MMFTGKKRFSEPRANKGNEVPKRVMWLTVVLIGVTVGLVNFTMVIADAKVIRLKFAYIQELLWDDGPVVAIPILILLSCLCTLIASTLTVFLAPLCAGSGLPEIKGYLNGNPMPGLFVLQRAWIRIFGIILVIAAGLPLGREGPMVCIGGSCGLLILTRIIKPYFQEWIRLAGDDELSIVMEEDNYHLVKRMGCTLGAAAGIAAAFNAPIGGCLYMFEETSGILNWTSFLTFGSFVCCGAAVVTNTAMMNLFGIDYRLVYQLVLFSMPEHERIEREPWMWLDLILIAVVAIVCGVAANLFTRGALWVWRVRQLPWNVVRSGRLLVGVVLLCKLFVRKTRAAVTGVSRCFGSGSYRGGQRGDRRRPGGSGSSAAGLGNGGGDAGAGEPGLRSQHNSETSCVSAGTALKNCEQMTDAKKSRRFSGTGGLVAGKNTLEAASSCCGSRRGRAHSSAGRRTSGPGAGTASSGVLLPCSWFIAPSPKPLRNGPARMTTAVDEPKDGAGKGKNSSDGDYTIKPKNDADGATGKILLGEGQHFEADPAHSKNASPKVGAQAKSLYSGSEYSDVCAEATGSERGCTNKQEDLGSGEMKPQGAGGAEEDDDADLDEELAQQQLLEEQKEWGRTVMQTAPPDITVSYETRLLCSKFGKICEVIVTTFLILLVLGLIPLLSKDCQEVEELVKDHKRRHWAAYTCEQDQPETYRQHLYAEQQQTQGLISPEIELTYSPRRRGLANTVLTHFNPLATMLLQGEEGAIKHLFARDYRFRPDRRLEETELREGGAAEGAAAQSWRGRELGGGATPPSSSAASGSGGESAYACEQDQPVHAFRYIDVEWLVLSLLIYAPLAMLIPGLSMPFGLFIPNLFMGAVLGRLGGELVHELDLPFRPAHPGFYAVCGAGAMLSGFTHMSIAIVALLVEATHDMEMVIPILVSIGFATLTNRLLGGENFDETLIKLKKVPLLHPELKLDSKTKNVGDVMERFAENAPQLRTEDTKIMDIILLLDMHPSLSHFVVTAEDIAPGDPEDVGSLLEVRDSVADSWCCAAEINHGEASNYPNSIEVEEDARRRSRCGDESSKVDCGSGCGPVVWAETEDAGESSKLRSKETRSTVAEAPETEHPAVLDHDASVQKQKQHTKEEKLTSAGGATDPAAPVEEVVALQTPVTAYAKPRSSLAPPPPHEQLQIEVPDFDSFEAQQRRKSTTRSAPGQRGGSSSAGPAVEVVGLITRQRLEKLVALHQDLVPGLAGFGGSTGLPSLINPRVHRLSQADFGASEEDSLVLEEEDDFIEMHHKQWERTQSNNTVREDGTIGPWDRQDLYSNRQSEDEAIPGFRSACSDATVFQRTLNLWKNRVKGSLATSPACGSIFGGGSHCGSTPGGFGSGGGFFPAVRNSVATSCADDANAASTAPGGLFHSSGDHFLSASSQRMGAGVPPFAVRFGATDRAGSDAYAGPDLPGGGRASGPRPVDGSGLRLPAGLPPSFTGTSKLQLPAVGSCAGSPGSTGGGTPVAAKKPGMMRASPFRIKFWRRTDSTEKLPDRGSMPTSPVYPLSRILFEGGSSSSTAAADHGAEKKQRPPNLAGARSASADPPHQLQSAGVPSRWVRRGSGWVREPLPDPNRDLLKRRCVVPNSGATSGKFEKKVDLPEPSPSWVQRKFLRSSSFPRAFRNRQLNRYWERARNRSGEKYKAKFALEPSAAETTRASAAGVRSAKTCGALLAAEDSETGAVLGGGGAEGEGGGLSRAPVRAASRSDSGSSTDDDGEQSEAERPEAGLRAPHGENLEVSSTNKRRRPAPRIRPALGGQEPVSSPTEFDAAESPLVLEFRPSPMESFREQGRANDLHLPSGTAPSETRQGDRASGSSTTATAKYPSKLRREESRALDSVAESALEDAPQTPFDDSCVDDSKRQKKAEPPVGPPRGDVVAKASKGASGVQGCKLHLSNKGDTERNEGARSEGPLEDAESPGHRVVEKAKSDGDAEDDQDLDPDWDSPPRRTPEPHDQSISLWNLIDPAPYCVGPDFPIQRIYPLFISAHPVPAVVVFERGRLRGVLTRRHLTNLSHD